MHHSGPIVIAGGGLAAHRAAEGLRTAGFDGRVVVVTSEPHRPYDRPPLSKTFLRAEQTREALFYRTPAVYASQDIEMRLSTTVVALHPAEHTVALSDGQSLLYHRLLIATGAAPRRLSIAGGALAGVHYLRTLEDAEQLSRALQAAGRVVVVGAGFIGSEVAASARQMGLDVTVLEVEEVPLLRALGPEIGAVYAGLHRDRGVTVLTSEGIAEIRGHGRVEEVITTTGRGLPCDVAVIGVGVRPNTDWLDSSGIALANGILVDDRCRTCLPDVFAAGDVARWPYAREGQHIRVEHWDNASNQGAHVAQALMDRPGPYQPIPYFWSDQYDVNMQYVGHAAEWDHVVLRGDVTAPSFTAFYLKRRRVSAALVVNRPRDLRPCRRLIEQGGDVEPDALASEATDLRRLAAAG